MNGKETERTKSEKVKAGYMKGTNRLQFLKEKKLFQNIKNSGE